MFKRALLSVASAILVIGAIVPTAQANDANDAAMEQALKALDSQLPGKLINNPYKVKWITHGSEKKDAIVKSEGAPGGSAYQVRVKKKKRNALNRDRTSDLQIFSLTLSQLSYRG